MLGRREAELVGLSLLDLVHPDDREMLRSLAGRSGEGDGKFRPLVSRVDVEPPLP